LTCSLIHCQLILSRLSSCNRILYEIGGALRVRAERGHRFMAEPRQRRGSFPPPALASSQRTRRGLALLDHIGLELKFGYELEFFVGRDVDELRPAHHGPAYSSEGNASARALSVWVKTRAAAHWIYESGAPGRGAPRPTAGGLLGDSGTCGPPAAAVVSDACTNPVTLSRL
jgi:hypothetical protein